MTLFPAAPFGATSAAVEARAAGVQAAEVRVTVYGAPEGARRHRVARRGAHVVAYQSDEHRDAEGRFVAAFAAALVSMPRPVYARAVEVVITSWHARPRVRALASR